MGTHSLTEAIRGKALELGFDLVGFAPTGVATRADRFRHWLAGGHHGEMSWLARAPEIRVDSRQRGGWGRSVVSVGMIYRPPGPPHPAEASGILGRIARYAAGEDYHRLLDSRLRQLLRFVETERPGTRGRIAVDTSALLERDLAESAGLGWSSKNTLLIHPDLGSWFFLGELILDCELDWDPRIEDQCGECRACVDACPTGAILEERMVDARRCISYLTIELRRTLSPEERTRVGGHLFGCDICQEVCPWNRAAPAGREPALRPRERWGATSLRDVAQMTEAAFHEAFRGSAMRRPGRAGIVRNALVAAANTGDGPALDAALDRLDDADPVVRSTAAWAAGRRGGARGRLEKARQRERLEPVREEIERALDDP